MEWHRTWLTSNLRMNATPGSIVSGERDRGQGLIEPVKPLEEGVNPGSPSGPGWAWKPSIDARREPPSQGQSYRESRPFGLSTIGFDGPAVGLDDPPADAQAQPAAARGSRGIHLVEPLEDMRQVLGRDADPGVAHPEHRPCRRRPSTRTVTEPPGSVNRIALSSRFVTSCRSRDGSPAIVDRPGDPGDEPDPLSSASGSNISTTSPRPGRQVDRFASDGDLAGIGPRQQQAGR